jgi:CheY-like chemotaxis protein
MRSDPKRILIVDDNAAIRTVSRFLFDVPGFEVCGEAVDGADAIKKAQDLCPDLIVLDLSMPEMNGLETARELADLMPKIPLIMFTNHMGEIVEEECRKVGVRAVMSKSEPFDKLMDHARRLVN